MIVFKTCDKSFDTVTKLLFSVIKFLLISFKERYFDFIGNNRLGDTLLTHFDLNLKGIDCGFEMNRRNGVRSKENEGTI